MYTLGNLNLSCEEMQLQGWKKYTKIRAYFRRKVQERLHCRPDTWHMSMFLVYCKYRVSQKKWYTFENFAIRNSKQVVTSFFLHDFDR